MEDLDLLRVGVQLKRLRMDKDWSIRDLADRSGIAASTISQIETGKTSPNLLTLNALATALDIPVYTLFLSDASHIHLVRSGERQTFMRSVSGGVPMTESMLIEGKNEMSGGEITLPPGSDSGAFARHLGEEFVYVLQGCVRFELENNGVYLLHPGDTLYYPNYIGHRWENAASEESRMLIVSTDPYRF